MIHADVGSEPTKWTEADQEKVISYFAKWPLKKLRKHQHLTVLQQERAGSNEEAMVDLQMIERLLTAAIDRREFE